MTDDGRPIIDDPEDFATELRTLADRIKDGEYELSELSIRRPAADGDPPGHFAIEFYTEEEMERMHRAFVGDDQ